MTIRSLSLGVALTGVISVGLFRGLDPGQLLNAQSVMIVFGGTALVLWLGFPARRVQETLKALRTALRRPPRIGSDTVLSRVLDLAGLYRLHGPLALERRTSTIEHDFLRFGATLIAEGYEEAALISALERENSLRQDERWAQIRLLYTLARLTPALGMAGTVVSLMQVLQDLTHPEHAGPSLGLALSSTLYGVLLANLFFLPLASKLEEFARAEAAERSMIIEALRGLHRAEHPLRIAERLNAYELYCHIKNVRHAEGAVVLASNGPAPHALAMTHGEAAR